MNKVTIFLAAVCLCLLSGQAVQAQTNPAAQPLPFSLTSHTGTTLPAGVAAHRFGTTAGAIPTTRTTAPGNADLPYSTSGPTSGGWRDEGANGISLLASGSNAAGALVVALDTTGQTNIKVSWVARTILQQASRDNSIALQYRLGTTGNYTDVDPSVYTSTGKTAGDAQSFTDVPLPAAAENQPYVQVRWVYWESASSSGGSRDRIAIDDISITGTGGPVTPTINVSTTSLADFGNVAVGTASAPKSYTVSGVGMSEGITITAPADFQVSTSSGSGYTTTLVLPQSGGNVSATTVYVRFAPTGLGAKGGNITHESAGAETKNVAVTGTGVNAYTISGTVKTSAGAPLAGVQISLAVGETPVSSTATDADGRYSFTGVAGGNEYIVSPSAAGFTFTPPSRAYSNLAANQTADFVAVPKVIISEFRFRGTGGATDEFIELYNRTDQAVGLTGWSLVSGGTVLHTISGGSIPARGHYLITGAGYSLPVASDAALGTDIPDGAGVALFNNSSNLATGARLDATGFSTADPLYREGNGLAPGGGITSDSEHAYVRRLTSGTPQDTDDNSADFTLVATDPVTVGHNAVLGAPGPQNRTSPTQRNSVIKASLIDPQCSGFGPATSGCARVRTADGANPTTAQYGTLRIRRKFTNTTASNVTSLRFRVVGITTLGSPGSGSGQADLRVVSSAPGDFSVTLTNGSSVPVRGTRVETPPAQPNGGGLNSTVVTVTTATPILPSDSVNVEFTLGVQQEGTFSFFVNVEAVTQAPPSSSVHLTMGNPSDATEDVNQPTNYLMVKEGYALSYHRDRGIPNWTSWHLDTTWLGSAPRQDDFRNDPSLPSGWYQVQGTDYSGSGFDRGHMTPSADRTSTVPLNSETFLMTNMVPQAPQNNQQTWNNMEQDLRALARAGNELYIISGGAGTGGVGNNGPANTIAGGKVTVPNSTWKVVIVLPQGTNDVSRVTASTRTIAVIVPNRNDVSADWRSYRVSVDAVESLTGFDFFSNVEDSAENAIESGVDSGTTAASPAMKAGAAAKGVTVMRLR